MGRNDKRTNWIWWAVLSLVLLLGLGCRAWLAAKNSYPRVDGVFYLEQSRQLIREGTLPFSSFSPRLAPRRSRSLGFS